MFFFKNKQTKAAQKTKTRAKASAKPNNLQPVLHVADSLKDYQKELAQREVESLSELGLVGSSFSRVWEAVRLPSADTVVHLSFSTFTFQSPIHTMGSTAMTMPGWNRAPCPAAP